MREMEKEEQVDCRIVVRLRFSRLGKETELGEDYEKMQLEKGMQDRELFWTMRGKEGWLTGEIVYVQRYIYLLCELLCYVGQVIL